MFFDSVLEFLSDDPSPAMEFDLLAGGEPNPNDTGGPTPAENPQNQATQTQQPAQQPQAQNTQTTDTAPDTGDDTGDMDMGNDEMGEDMGDDEFGGDGEDMEDVDTNSTNTSDPDIERKISLRKLILALITAYDSSIIAMTKVTPPAEDGLSEKYYNLQEKMSCAKSILHEIAIRDIYTKPYEDSLRRYSAMNQLYSICVEYLRTIMIRKPGDIKRKKHQPTAFKNNVKVIR